MTTVSTIGTGVEQVRFSPEGLYPERTLARRGARTHDDYFTDGTSKTQVLGSRIPTITIQGRLPVTFSARAQDAADQLALLQTLEGSIQPVTFVTQGRTPLPANYIVDAVLTEDLEYSNMLYQIVRWQVVLKYDSPIHQGPDN